MFESNAAEAIILACGLVCGKLFGSYSERSKAQILKDQQEAEHYGSIYERQVKLIDSQIARAEKAESKLDLLNLRIGELQLQISQLEKKVEELIQERHSFTKQIENLIEENERLHTEISAIRSGAKGLLP